MITGMVFVLLYGGTCPHLGTLLLVVNFVLYLHYHNTFLINDDVNARREENC